MITTWLINLKVFITLHVELSLDFSTYCASANENLTNFTQTCSLNVLFVLNAHNATIVI